MCGIWLLCGVHCSYGLHCNDAFTKICHRGPDAWRLEMDARLSNILFGFHRLSIVDPLHGMQPMRLHSHPHLMLLCNGEIFNYKQVKDSLNKLSSATTIFVLARKRWKIFSGNFLWCWSHNSFIRDQRPGRDSQTPWCWIRNVFDWFGSREIAYCAGSVRHSAYVCSQDGLRRSRRL